MKESGADLRGGAYETLDAWRGIAALWVVVFHAASEVLGSFPAARGGTVYEAASIGWLGVQIFFVISGYCIANAACSNVARQKGWTAFAWARLRRIYPPMWFSLVFYALFKSAASIAASRGMLGEGASPASGFLNQGFLYYFANVSLTQIVFHQEWLSRVCWTLGYEIAFYLATALFIVVADRLRRPRLVLGALHSITVLSLAGLLFAPAAMFYPFDLWPQFGLGVAVYDLLRSREKVAARNWSLVIAMLTAAFIAVHHLPLGFQMNPSRSQYVTALGLAVLLVALRRFDRALARVGAVRWLSAIGLFSYSLYLVHFLVITVLLRVLASSVPASLHLALMAFLCLASVAAGWIFYRFFERPFVHLRPDVVATLPALEPAQ